MEQNTLFTQKCEQYPFLEVNDERLSMTDSQIIDKDINLSKSVVSQEDKDRLKNILLTDKQALSLHGEVGNCVNFEVDFELEDKVSFYIRPYKASLDDKILIDKSLDKLVKNVLKQGLTDYRSPIMLINKKNSKEKQQVVDLQHINSKI